MFVVLFSFFFGWAHTNKKQQKQKKQEILSQKQDLINDPNSEKLFRSNTIGEGQLVSQWEPQILVYKPSKR